MRPLLLLTGLTLLLAPPALADQVAPVTDPDTRARCGECHMAFQPAFLPARSWERIMDTLSDHYGDRVTLKPEQAAHIRAVLVAGAADRAGGKVARRVMARVDPAGTPLRLTENPDFLRRHDFPAREWARPEVKVKSNCPACHRRAEAGDYEED
ncbi:cytochrome C [Phaeospirillum tilakii]|uniref:Cytochrome C n=1 Tax=Phaeospirillum tilakii TaxID=741673 RepID=A0ABW5C8I5_9PROT